MNNPAETAIAPIDLQKVQQPFATWASARAAAASAPSAPSLAPSDSPPSTPRSSRIAPPTDSACSLKAPTALAIDSRIPSALPLPEEPPPELACPRPLPWDTADELPLRIHGFDVPLMPAPPPGSPSSCARAYRSECTRVLSIICIALPCATSACPKAARVLA